MVFHTQLHNTIHAIRARWLSHLCSRGMDTDSAVECRLGRAGLECHRKALDDLGGIRANPEEGQQQVIE